VTRPYPPAELLADQLTGRVVPAPAVEQRARQSIIKEV
jgi:hypothetical protein